MMNYSYKGQRSGKQCTAANERFYESGGVCPQKHLCKFASVLPARTFVSPRLHKAAGTLHAMRATMW